MTIDWTSVASIASVVALLFTGYQIYHQRRQSIPQLNVILKENMNFSLIQGLGVVDQDMVFTLTVSNTGAKTVSLSSCGLLMPNKLRISMVEHLAHFPVEVQPEKSFKLNFPFDRVLSELNKQGYDTEVKLKGYFEDEAERIYFSKPKKINLATARTLNNVMKEN